VIMEYRNKKTGAVIDVNSELGGDWEPVEAPKSSPKKEKEPVKAPVKKKGTVKK